MQLKYLLIMICIHVSVDLLSQSNGLVNLSVHHKEKPLVGFLGELRDTVFEYYPIQSDYSWEYYCKFAKTNSLLVLKYPLLIINGVVVRDVDMLNSFRNNDSIQIQKTIIMNQYDARKKLNISDIPKDGVIMVFTKRKQFVDLRW